MSFPFRRVAGSAALAAVAGLALFLAGDRQSVLLEVRRQEKLTQADPLENLPPWTAFSTVALGAFRGILVDILWVRAASLQQEGRYVELVQLSDWITKLQPRFAVIWSYHAWNLAYNVSVLFEEPEDRWRWVRHGIHLLRDQGLHYNPGSALLYRELALLFEHKIGEDSDRANGYYKQQWAAEMTDLLGGGRPDWSELTSAPATRAEWRKTPGAPWMEQQFLEAGIDPFLLPAVDGSLPDRLAALLQTPAGVALRAHQRVLRLRDEAHLEPARMREVDEKFGPLDWRLPNTQAIYWAALGLPYARTDVERAMLERQILQSLTHSFLRGRLRFEPEKNLYLLTPNPDVLDRVRAVYVEALDRQKDELILRSHRDFLVDAVMICSAFNRLPKAKEVFEELRRRYPEKIEPKFDSFLEKTYREFVERNSSGETTAAVESAFYQSAYWEAAGDADQAAGYDRIARLIWERYRAARSDTEQLQRTGLPPLEEFRRAAQDRLREDRKAAPLKPTR